MCCFTHTTVYPGTEPPDPKMHCQCGVGQPDDGGNDPDETMFNSGFGPCQRVATREDLLCDICAGRPNEFDTPSPFTGMASVDESGMADYLKEQMTNYFNDLPLPNFGKSQWAWERPSDMTFNVNMEPVPDEPGKFIAYGADAEELIRRIKKIPPG